MTGTMTKAESGVDNLLSVAEEVQSAVGSASGPRRILAISRGIVALTEAMPDEVVATFIALQNSPMGFRTDREQGYSPEVVKQCCAHALLHGANLVDDEFQIIAGQCYFGQKFYIRKLKEYPGVSDVQIDVEIPEVSNKVEGGKDNWVMLVGGYACCNVQSKKVEVFARKHPKFGDSRCAVTAYGRGIDMAQGKAKKRLAQKLYERVAGVEITEGGGEAIVVDPAPAPSESEAPVDWKAEFERYGVMDQASLLRDAPDAKSRQDVLDAAREQVKAGTLDQRALDCLQRYADTK